MLFFATGTSILKDILDTKLPQGIIIDYQHVSLLRHTKTLLYQVYKQFNPSQRQLFDIKLKQQCFPHFFNRRMKTCKDLSFMKAVELRNVLIYGLLPLSYEFINHEQLAHMSLFICAIRLYHSQPPMFGQTTATIANQLFKQYYKDHRKFYHLIQNYVLHLHAHYDDQYVNYGSLSNIGCFPQEDLIGHVSSNTYGTRYYGDQMAHYYNINFSLHNRVPHTKYDIHSKPIDLNPGLIIDNYTIIIAHHNRICSCLNIPKCISIYRRCIIRRSYSQCNTIYEQMTSDDVEDENDEEEQINESEEDILSTDDNSYSQTQTRSPLTQKRKRSSLTIADDDEESNNGLSVPQQNLSTKQSRYMFLAHVLYQTIDQMQHTVLHGLEKKLKAFSKKVDRLVPALGDYSLDSYREKDEIFNGKDLLTIRGRDIYDFGRQILRELFTPQELNECILPPGRKHLSRPPLDVDRFNIFHEAVRIKYRLSALHYDSCFSKLIKPRMSDFLIDERKRQAKALLRQSTATEPTPQAL
ncbi:unnamed protein product [Adineta steineri]|uniref:Uncharacterized protein n=1 Tax=Adineta steineri TaxID=433720 RepID=A0A815TI35_9BILA|nr:unnamed protein product [Adineta steineri]CAF1506774.1 unnamed protein product [Adineta steineri]